MTTQFPTRHHCMGDAHPATPMNVTNVANTTIRVFIRASTRPVSWGTECGDLAAGINRSNALGTWGAPTWRLRTWGPRYGPQAPNVRSASAEPWRSSVLRQAPTRGTAVLVR